MGLLPHPHDWEGLYSSRTHETYDRIHHTIIIALCYMDDLTLIHWFLIFSFTTPHLASSFVYQHCDTRSYPGLLLAECHSGVSYEPVIGRGLNQDIPFGGLIRSTSLSNCFAIGDGSLGWLLCPYHREGRVILGYPLVHQWKIPT